MERRCIRQQLVLMYVLLEALSKRLHDQKRLQLIFSDIPIMLQMQWGLVVLSLKQLILKSDLK